MARVLVVDDDPDLLTLVEMQLKHHGHRVVTACGAVEALAIIDEKGAPDVAVLDVAMPGMNGLDLLRELRSRPEMSHLPAIFLSARVGADDIEAGTSLAAMYLTKPYVMNALLKAIETVLSQQQAASGW